MLCRHVTLRSAVFISIDEDHANTPHSLRLKGQIDRKVAITSALSTADETLRAADTVIGEENNNAAQTSNDEVE